MQQLINLMQQTYDEINNVTDSPEHLTDEQFLLLEQTRGFLAETIEVLSNP